jgi:hypothetical protein
MPDVSGAISPNSDRGAETAVSDILAEAWAVGVMAFLP